MLSSRADDKTTSSPRHRDIEMTRVHLRRVEDDCHVSLEPFQQEGAADRALSYSSLTSAVLLPNATSSLTE